MTPNGDLYANLYGNKKNVTKWQESLIMLATPRMEIGGIGGKGGKSQMKKSLLIALLALPLLGCAKPTAQADASDGIEWRTDAQSITVLANSGSTITYATYFPIRWAYEEPALYVVDEKSIREFYNVAFEVVLKGEEDAGR